MDKTVLLAVVSLALVEFSLADFSTEAINAHNIYRSSHGVSNLMVDPEITVFAQNWANYLAATNQFYHRPNSPYGENLYMMGGRQPSAQDAVNAWYAEGKDYVYGVEPADWASTGHFTQEVWKSSKNAGCAIARNGNNHFVVCNYDPPGNVMGQYVENVLPPIYA